MQESKSKNQSCSVYVVVALLLIGPNCWALQTRDGIPWHVEDATLRFRIEKDRTFSQVPDVYLSDLEAVKGPSDLKKPKAKGRWTGTYYKLNRRLYKKGIRTSCPATVVYKSHRKFGHFVALVGVTDRADPNTSVSFEVWADRKKLYKSGLLTKQISPVEINVRIPSASKEIKLVTKGSDLKGRRWANWVNAGFLLKGKNPQVGAVALCAPGYDPTELEAVVFSSTGDRVGSRLLWTQQGEPMEIVFDSSHGWLVYFVYLVHKDNYKSTSSPWQPRAGLTLETRCANRIYPECNKLSGLLRVWDEVAEPVGKSFVDNIHHGFPIHRLPESGSDNTAKKAALALYRYEGFFRIEKAGQYTFATASNWGSYLLIDGKPVVSWPGKHDYRAGIRGEKRGRIALVPGVHRLEYLNYSPWGKMLTLAAWSAAGGREKLSIMTRSDFLPVRGYVATEIGYKEGPRSAGTQPAKDKDSFQWQIVDDWRLDHQMKATLVRMRFNVIKAKRTGSYSYRWRFEDGKMETGESVEHVFLRPGMRTVTLELLKGQEVVASVTDKVHVHALWNKVSLDPQNVQAFEKAIAESDFNKVPIGDLVNLYIFCDGLKRSRWKQQVVAALINRMEELVAESEYWNFCLELGQHLRSAPIRQYQQALTLFSRLREKSTKGKDPTSWEASLVWLQASLYQAELLIQCEGYAQQALQILNQLQMQKNLNGRIARRLRITQAEALVALGQVDRAREILQNVSTEADSKQADKTSQEIKHAGMLRHARLLAEHQDDPAQLDYAMEQIEAILTNDPAKVLMPSLNLVRLDIHLARKEYKIAFHLAERLNKLELSNYDRLEVLVRQVKALCGLPRRVEQAKALYEAAMKDYPYSPAVAEAKKAIVEAVVVSQKQ